MNGTYSRALPVGKEECALETLDEKGESMEQQRELDAMSVILGRRSVREYTGEPVESESIELILRAGMAAPTARNMQPWSFVTVTWRETLIRLADGLPYGKMLASAGAAIAVCALPDLANNGSSELAVVDGTCAAENMLLAAASLGLGAVWVAAYPYDDRMEHLRDVLGIPGTVIPLCVIPLGHPVSVKPPIDKYKPEKIHRERW